MQQQQQEQQQQQQQQQQQHNELQWLRANTPITLTHIEEALIDRQGRDLQVLPSVISAVKTWITQRFNDNNYIDPFQEPEEDRIPESFRALLTRVLSTAIDNFVVHTITQHARRLDPALRYYRGLDPDNPFPPMHDFMLIAAAYIMNFDHLHQLLTNYYDEETIARLLMECNIKVGLKMHHFILEYLDKHPPTTLDQCLRKFIQAKGYQQRQRIGAPFGGGVALEHAGQQLQLRQHLNDLNINDAHTVYENIREQIIEGDMITNFVNQEGYHPEIVMMWLRKRLHQINGQLQYRHRHPQVANNDNDQQEM
ncbi:hypothetical protein O0I10_006819 [Lichtheimia ornata]|uniref:Uncharacterized protein n=1 Tax=Lichtheimia ornata TaxID=688661 RepID=A0AAD7Y0Q9_9FUNG|nr:uncharacterized protein O0I10_006819 [Lichtheimia ornata]KAJ8657517.1 hypothetical protein O0I10_006819 [Lichtheimia ornata]